MSESPQTTIGCVIVNWNSKDDTLAAISSLRGQEKDLPIVVVDNASSDGSFDAVRSAFPDVDVLAEHMNHGLAEGSNLGIHRFQKADWIFLLNNDATVMPGCWEVLREAAAAAPPDVGMIQPCIVLHDQPEIVNSTGVTIFPCGYARDRDFGHPVASALKAAEIFSSTAGASLYRRSMLDEVKLRSGWLDRNFFMYFEDVDLGWRCRLAGWRAIYVPDSVVRHKFQASSKKRGNRFVIDQCRANRVIALIKNASWQKILRTMPVTIKDTIKSTYMSGFGHALGILRRIPGAIRDRYAVAKRAKVQRQDLEKQWMNTKPTPAPFISRE